MLQGEQLPGERDDQHRYGWQPPDTFTLQRRAEGPTIHVPPGKVWVVDLRLVEPISVPETAPDLAIAARDLVVDGSRLKVTVHNIGNGPSAATQVALQVCENALWRTVSETPLPPMDSPVDWQPRRETVRLQIPRLKSFRITVDAKDAQFEWNEGNNMVEWRVE